MEEGIRDLSESVYFSSEGFDTGLSVALAGLSFHLLTGLPLNSQNSPASAFLRAETKGTHACACKSGKLMSLQLFANLLTAH